MKIGDEPLPTPSFSPARYWIFSFVFGSLYQSTSLAGSNVAASIKAGVAPFADQFLENVGRRFPYIIVFPSICANTGDLDATHATTWDRGILIRALIQCGFPFI
jgi:hypothetical protein